MGLSAQLWMKVTLWRTLHFTHFATYSPGIYRLITSTTLPGFCTVRQMTQHFGKNVGNCITIHCVCSKQWLSGLRRNGLPVVCQRNWRSKSDLCRPEFSGG